MTATYTCHACLAVHRYDETVMGKYSRVKNRDTRRVRFCRTPGCKCTTFLRFEEPPMSQLYHGHTLVEILKGNYPRENAPDIIAALARRVADLEREARTVFREDGRQIECASIEEARAIQRQNAMREPGPTWNTSAVVPPPAAADRELIAVLKSGKVVSGEIRVDGSPIGFCFLAQSDSQRLPWEEIAAWTYKPGMAA